MSSKVVEICEKNINPIIESLGYEVVEIEYSKKVDGMNLSFFIDSPKGITLDDCEKVSKTINDVLDEIDPTNNQTYILNVCSPGLDRPIKNQKDFLRNKGKKVDVKLFTQMNGAKKFTGFLENFDESGVSIKLENGDILKFEKEKIAVINPVIEL